MPCAAKAKVARDQVVNNTLPALRLLPPGSSAENAPVSAAGVPLSLTQILTYGVPAPISFSPCASYDANAACAAIAMDVEDGDLTSFINVSGPVVRMVTRGMYAGTGKHATAS